MFFLNILSVFLYISNEVIAAWIGAAVGIIVAILALIGQARERRKNNINQKELEVYKNKLDRYTRFKADQITYIESLLSAVYALRLCTGQIEINQTLSRENACNLLQLHMEELEQEYKAFRTLYSANVGKTNDLDSGIRRMVHDLIKKYYSYRDFVKALIETPAAITELRDFLKDTERHRELFLVHIHIFEDDLRETLKKEKEMFYHLNETPGNVR